MFRTNSRGRAWKIRRQTVRQVFCLLTAVSLVFQQVGVCHAYCTGLSMTGPCAGNPNACCASLVTSIVGSSGSAGDGRGCWGGSCGGEENVFQPATSANPVHLVRGGVLEQATDLAVSGPNFTWAQTRTYDSLNTVYDQGRWQSTTRGLWLYGTSTSLYLYQDATYTAYFYQDGQNWISPAGSLMTFAYDAANYEYILTDPVSGRQWIFYNLSGATSGKLKRETTRAWTAAGRDGAVYSYDGSGYLTQITTPEGQDYNIVFSYSGNNVTKMEVRTGATSATRIKEVEYTRSTPTGGSSTTRATSRPTTAASPRTNPSA